MKFFANTHGTHPWEHIKIIYRMYPSKKYVNKILLYLSDITYTSCMQKCKFYFFSHFYIIHIIHTCLHIFTHLHTKTIIHAILHIFTHFYTKNKIHVFFTHFYLLSHKDYSSCIFLDFYTFSHKDNSPIFT